MEELTLRLPAETKQSLRAEAAERGITIGEHVRDIIDTYHGADQTRDRPEIDVEYAHTVADGARTASESDSTASGRSEEIGTFSYGSRSPRP